MDNYSGRQTAMPANYLVLFTSAFGLALSVVYLYILGPLIQPMESELGWGRAEIFGGLSIVAVLSVIGAPVAGLAIDKYGPRKVAIIGTVIYCGSISALSVSSSLLTWYLIWFGVALGSIFVKPTVWFVAVARHFEARRGTAIGVALCGSGLGTAVIPVLSKQLFGVLGWRDGLFAIGCACAAVMLPLLLVAFPVKSLDLVRRDIANTSANVEEDSPKGGKLEMLILCICGFLVNFSVMALSVNFLPLVEWSLKGSSYSNSILSIIGVTSILARPISGWLMDRHSAQLIASVSYSIPIAAIVFLLAGNESSLALICAAGLIGVALGSEVDSFAYLSSRYFKQEELGWRLGTIMGFVSLGVGLGPLTANIVFDLMGSYTQLLLGIVILLAVSSLLVISMRSYVGKRAGENVL